MLFFLRSDRILLHLAGDRIEDMKKTLLLSILAAMIVLLEPISLLGQTYLSLAEETGYWMENSTWRFNSGVPVINEGQRVTIYIHGTVVRDGDLTFNASTSEISIENSGNGDTLIVTGNLVFNNKVTLNIKQSSLLIVLGDLVSNDQVTIYNSGTIAVVGSVITSDPTTVNNSNGSFYIFEEEDLDEDAGTEDAWDLATNDRVLADYLRDVWGVQHEALPIELKSFTVNVRNDAIQLEWVTAKEDNFSHFEVERSVNMEDFETIGLVQGKGESLSDVYYDLEDKNAPFGVLYYRLKSVDIDNTFLYSPVIRIENGFNGQVRVYPNPAVQTDQLKIHLPSYFNGEIIRIALYDLQGAKVQEFFSFDPAIELSVNNQLKSGLYLLRIQYNGLEENLRVLIK